MFKINLFIAHLLLCFYANAKLPPEISGISLLTNKKITLSTKFNDKLNDKKALVVIFMSAKCPCSDSHISIIKRLSETYRDFKFAVIHSNINETKAEAKKYFKKAGFNFDVISDTKTQIADQLQAFKTPHAFVISPNSEILYQGGVTNSSMAASADTFYLENALKDIASGQKVKTPEGRTLGCVILREGEIK